MSKAKLVYKDAKSNKFWEIEAKGSSINILYGRVGTNGQTLVKKAKSVINKKQTANKSKTNTNNKLLWHIVMYRNIFRLFV